MRRRDHCAVLEHDQLSEQLDALQQMLAEWESHRQYTVMFLHQFPPLCRSIVLRTAVVDIAYLQLRVQSMVKATAPAVYRQ